jgi:hypothetical protein
MAKSQLITLDFLGATRIINLPDGVDPQDPATVAQLEAPQETVTVNAGNSPYTVTDADNGKIIEISGARTITVGSLTAAFQSVDIIQLDANNSTISGTFTGDYGSTQTQNVAGSRTYLQRVAGGTVYFKGEVG